MNTYKTSEIARYTGIHPNTVRLYEELGLITPPERSKNGYRIFTDLQLEQIQLIRTALRVEVLQNGLRKQVFSIVKACAQCEYDRSISLAKSYLKNIQLEISYAEEAILIARSLLYDTCNAAESTSLTRKETATYLQVTIDTLRNWEMNGLLSVKRRQNGYRMYTGEDINRLKVIRSLRCANYSLSSILRMLNSISQNSTSDIRHVIDTPTKDEDVISVCDKLLTSLHYAEENAAVMLLHLNKIKKDFSFNPPL